MAEISGKPGSITPLIELTGLTESPNIKRPRTDEDHALAESPNIKRPRTDEDHALAESTNINASLPKNNIMQIFRVMNLANKVMKQNKKDATAQTRLFKETWKTSAQDLSKTYEESIGKYSTVQIISAASTVLGVIIPHLDKVCVASTNTDGTELLTNVGEFLKYVIPSEKNVADRLKIVKDFSDSISKSAIDLKAKTIEADVQASVALNTQKNEGDKMGYQNQQEETKSLADMKKQLTEVERQLVQMEGRSFEVRG